MLGGHPAHRPLPCLPWPSRPAVRKQRKQLGLPRPPRFLRRCKNKESLAGSQVAPGGPALPPASPAAPSAIAPLPSCSAPAELLTVGAHVPVLQAEPSAVARSARAPPPSSSTELPCVGTAPGFLSSGCLLLLSPFVLSPPPSSLCRQLGPPPSSASSRNQTPSGPDAVCVAERCGSCSPVRGQSGAWISGNVRTASGSPAPLRCSLIPEQHQVLFTEAPSRA